MKEGARITLRDDVVKRLLAAKQLSVADGGPMATDAIPSAIAKTSTVT